MSYDAVLGLSTVMGTVVAVATTISGAYKRRLAFMERKLELAADAGTEKAAQVAARYAAHSSELENRVRVLERIITDGGNGHDIARQIEALRDTGRVSEVTTQ
ncbi:hypothetical protein [Novosphingobium sp. AP12]|uniref:hypothetical protein n=1 Tax=Novosphingobium sp. AP12 TaxID=1144305 RepID=UPI0002721F54|nr:hypothetical protein [Novosphingobium sp. AP12]EJL23602.1 hypothetical protein PMI02_04096 [Novosphingobium sp. AP12]